MDRVEKFTNKFESAVESYRSFAVDRQVLAIAKRQADRLSNTLDQISTGGGTNLSLSSADLRALFDELDAMRTPPLDDYLTKARALLAVVDEGIVDGDSTRLRELVSEAETLTRSKTRSKSSGDKYLEVPAKVVCIDCDEILVGQRQGVRYRQAITKAIRDHEEGVHGLYEKSTRNDVTRALTDLRSGQTLVSAGRYNIGQL